MKNDANKNYRQIALLVLIVALFAVVCVFACFNYTVIGKAVSKLISILSPIIYGAVFAFIFNPLVVLCDKRIFKFVSKKKERRLLKRTLSVIFTYLVIALLVTAFFGFVVPQVVNSYKTLEGKMNEYISSAQKWIDNMVAQSPFLKEQYDNITEKLQNLLLNSYTVMKQAVPYALEIVGNVLTHMQNIVIGFIISVYFLFSKENLKSHTKRALRSFMSRKRYERTVELSVRAYDIFGTYLSGSLIDALVVWVLCFISMNILSLPYAPLISTIVAITNLIPFFGPFIGGIPSAFIIFITNPMQAVWFVLMILVLQQIDGNFINPKIQGSRLGVPSVYVVMFVLVFGGLFGIPGMFLAVPVLAFLYSVIGENVSRKLSAKGEPIETEAYITHKKPVTIEDALEGEDDKSEDSETEK